MNTVGAFPAGGGDDFRRKISGPNPTIEATVESRRRERANADVGLIYITGHSGRFLEDPHATQTCQSGCFKAAGRRAIAFLASLLRSGSS
jgi:hypothetical protein